MIEIEIEKDTPETPDAAPKRERARPPRKPAAPRDTWFDDLRRHYAEATRTYSRRLKEEQAYEGDDWGDPDEDDWSRGR